MRIRCPHCGPCDQSEFLWGDEANVVRPRFPEYVDDAQWTAHLYFRSSPRGAVTERWHHVYGCGAWFTIERDTFTHRWSGA